MTLSAGSHAGCGAHKLFPANSDSLLGLWTPRSVARRELYAPASPRTRKLRSSERATTPGHKFFHKKEQRQQVKFSTQKRSKPTGVSGSQKRTLLLFSVCTQYKCRYGYMKLPQSTTPRSERGYCEAKEASPARPRAGRAAGPTCDPEMWENTSTTALSTPRVRG